MSIIEAVKAAGEVVIEAVKENPVIAACAVAGTLAIGGGIYYCKKSSDKKAEDRCKEVIRTFKAAEEQPAVEQTTA